MSEYTHLSSIPGVYSLSHIPRPAAAAPRLDLGGRNGARTGFDAASDGGGGVGR